MRLDLYLIPPATCQIYSIDNILDHIKFEYLIKFQNTIFRYIPKTFTC